MGYEIPQQLKHKEKIVFNLTAPQLGWVTLFLFLTLLIFKLNISIEARFALGILPTVLGLLFAFFDFYTHLKNFINFLKFRYTKQTSNKMKKLIPIKKVENNTIYTKESEIAILKITPINFTIKTTQEKESIILGFQNFLNSLDFPVQFIITTQTLKIDDYLDELESKTNDTTLFEDFKSFMLNLIQENKMRNRDFYLAIKKTTDLKIQTQLCIERFNKIGLEVTRLKDKDLLPMLFNFFNDEGDERSSDLIKNPLHYLIGPNEIKDTVDSFQINKKYARVISAVGYPRTVLSGFLDKIISTNDDFDISMHVEPFPIDFMMISLNKELQKQRADLFAEQLKNSVNPSLEIKYKDTLSVLEQLQKGQEKLFNVSLYINAKAETLENLDYLTNKIEAELNSIMIMPKIPYFNQIKGYQSTMPLAKDNLGNKRNITTQALSAFFPFTSPFLTSEKDGVMLGLNKNKVPFIRDIYSLSNANGVVLATSGSGKSYFTKLLILRQLLSGTKIMIIDPQSEYLNLTAHCKGELITISKTSETIINPLDLMGHDYVEKRLMLMDLFKVMFGELTEIQRAILDKAITETYAKAGITKEGYKKTTEMPILSDLYEELELQSKKANKVEKLTYQALLNRLYMYTEGVFSFMNRETNIDFNSDFVCFNIGDMPKQVKPVVMFLILDYVYMKMKQIPERKLLAIDEAWSLLGKSEEASYIFEIVKTCRKFNLGLLLITQDVEDLVSSKAGSAVLANSSYSLLLRQKPSVIDNIVKLFHLSKLEKNYLLTANQGKGILIMDNEHQELEVIAAPKEHEIITTNADEILKLSTKRKTKKPKNKIKIGLDLDKGLFYGKNLSMEEKNYLANHGYKAGSFVPMGKARSEECWVKTNNVESLEHTFLVQNIKQELLKVDPKAKIEINLVKLPDLIYKNENGEEVAFEVETGKNFGKHKKRLEKKFNDLKMNYHGDLIVVLTNAKKKHYYEQLLQGDFPIFLRNTLKQRIEAQIKRNKKSPITG